MCSNVLSTFSHLQLLRQEEWILIRVCFVLCRIKCESLSLYFFSAIRFLHFYKNMSVWITMRRSDVSLRHNKHRLHLHPGSTALRGYYPRSMRLTSPRMSLLISATVQTRRTGNKSDYTVRGVMFNNNNNNKKKYYLPWSMCAAATIKYNKRKVLGDCSKFWCVAILNTLWQHTACRGSKTSPNRVLNIRTPRSHASAAIHHGPGHAMLRG